MGYKLLGQTIVDILKEDKIFVEASDNFNACLFSQITFNSKDVMPQGLFICKGIGFKPIYLEDAVNRGASAYLSETILDSDVPFVITTNIRRAMALVAKAFYHYQPSDFDLIGVTGTKGKSTTVYYIKNILEAGFGKAPAYLTTVDVFDGISHQEATLTTPEPTTSYATFARAREHGVHQVVMELSSQSDKMDRALGMFFKYGVFVNISEDHIAPNEHQNFDEYLTCKMNIVSRYENAVINLDDDHAAHAQRAAQNAKSILTYSLRSDAGADIYAKDITIHGHKTKFVAVTPDWEMPMEIVILGVFNVSNALAGIAIGYLLGIPPDKIALACGKTQVGGRMNVFSHNGYTAIVDYAHNKASLESALDSITSTYPDKKVTLIFGCPGNKAYNRRSELSEIAAKAKVYSILTNEDPQFENPADIINEVISHLDAFGGAYEVIMDRKTAIETAIGRMKKDEVIFIAGKGMETYQYQNGIPQPYEGDTNLVEKAILKKIL